jgi:Fanconi anemia group M protein
MMIEVEKVLEGGAIVSIDDKWHARLEATNYNGPRELIKKGKKFKALCELYQSSGTLNLNVRQVVQAAS